MDLYDVMRTTFAARQFIDEPVPDAVIHRILDNARFAPSGGNRQGWRVIVVRDQGTRDALPALIRPTMQRYVAQVQAGEAPWNTINATALSDEQIAATEVPEPMIQALTQAPVLLFVFLDLAVAASFDQHLDRVGG
jgi:nitroreductase